MNYTRLTRSIVNSEMNKPYIKMAQLFHVPTRTILIRHLTPKIIPAIIVLMVVDFGKIILYISSLSFIGLGAQPPTPEWGAMLQQGRDFISSHPIMLIAPASVIAITILIFNLTGDALRDRLLKQRVNMMSLIDIQNLTIKNTSEKSLIKGIDLKIFSQQINALIGEAALEKV